MTIYVSNVSYDANEDLITALFSTFGTVRKISLPIDTITGRQKGFCFIDFEEVENEDSAITGLNGYEFLDRCLIVHKAMSNEASDTPTIGNRSRSPSRSRR